jgi:hypothetical protein
LLFSAKVHVVQIDLMTAAICCEPSHKHNRSRKMSISGWFEIVQRAERIGNRMDCGASPQLEIERRLCPQFRNRYPCLRQRLEPLPRAVRPSGLRPRMLTPSNNQEFTKVQGLTKVPLGTIHRGHLNIAENSRK